LGQLCRYIHQQSFLTSHDCSARNLGDWRTSDGHGGASHYAAEERIAQALAKLGKAAAQMISNPLPQKPQIRSHPAAEAALPDTAV